MDDEKSLNPVYFWLTENLFTEQAIAGQKNDLDSYALTLSSDLVLSPGEFKTKFDILYKSLSRDKFKLKYVMASSILLYLSKKHKITVKSEDVSQIKSEIASIHDKNLPLKYLILTYYFSKFFDPSMVKELEKKLSDNRDLCIKQNNLDDLIEIEFALGQKYFSRSRWDSFDIESSTFYIGKLSKLGLLYFDLGNFEKAKSIINNVEKRVWEKISTASLPTISLMVYEAEKLISTNLPSNDLTEILQLLKRQNKAWAKLITNIQTNGVTVDLKNFNNMSALDPEDTSWCINLLVSTKRDRTYQIGEGEYGDFKNFLKTKTKNALPVSRSSVMFFTSFICLIVVLAYIYFIDRHGLSISVSFFRSIKDLNVLWQDIKNIKFSGFETIGEVLTSPPTVLFIVLSTVWRSWLYLRKEHEFDIKYALKSALYVWKYK